jgi:hypothetical protein
LRKRFGLSVDNCHYGVEAVNRDNTGNWLVGGSDGECQLVANTGL